MYSRILVPLYGQSHVYKGDGRVDRQLQNTGDAGNRIRPVAERKGPRRHRSLVHGPYQKAEKGRV